MQTGKYRIKKQINVGITGCAFTAIEGSEIEVKQVDDAHSKVLIDFGGRMIDWFHKGWLERNASAL